jgi:hypothetical protein
MRRQPTPTCFILRLQKEGVVYVARQIGEILVGEPIGGHAIQVEVVGIHAQERGVFVEVGVGYGTDDVNARARGEGKRADYSILAAVVDGV